MTFAGATSARFSALQAGAVDAAILTPPFNFHAQSAGFTLLGHTIAICRHAVRRHRGEPQLGGGEHGHGAEGDRRLQQEHGLAVRSGQSRRGGADPDEGQQDQAGRRRAGLRFPDQGQVFRADRQDFEVEARQARRCAEEPRRPAAGFRRRPAVPARRDAGQPTDMLERIRQNYLAGTLSVVGGLAVLGVGEPRCWSPTRCSWRRRRRSSTAIYDADA